MKGINHSPFFLFALVLLLNSCYRAISTDKDIQLGILTSNQIHSNPKTYPLLSRTDNPVAYRELKRIVNNVLLSPNIKYKNIFEYDSITIINDDQIINAFCTPGGFIFVYTGLIKMANSEDEIAAVIGHEIAHAELRHSVKKLYRSFGRQAIIIAAAATAGASFGVFIAVEVGNKILGLGLSRDQEDHADKYSVIYLGSVGKYSSTALAKFFNRLISSGKDIRIPPIISNHPNTPNRIHRVKKWAKKYNYSTKYHHQPGFQTLVNSFRSKNNTNGHP